MDNTSTRGEPSSFWSAFIHGETFRALHNRNFTLLMIGQSGHGTSLWIETVARSWLIWELTGSATLLALVQLLRAIPMLSLGLFAGVAADRFDKRRILIICQAFTLVNKIVLAVLITTGVVEVWHVLLTAFLMGCSHSFEQPVRTALIPSLVKREELTNAIALNSAAMNGTRIIGPGIAGLLIAPLGIDGVYYLSSFVYVATLIATFMMQVPPLTGETGRASLWSDMIEAVRYINREKRILVLMLLALVPMLFGMPYMTILPVFADKVLNVGASGYGLLYSATGAGAFLAVLLIATLGKVAHKGWLILLGTFCFGAFLMAFSQSTWFPLSMLIVGMVGFAHIVPRVLINTSLLETTPQSLHGRIMAFYSLDRGLMPLGTMVAGPLADAMGAPPTVLMMGGICVLLALSIGIAVPLARRLT